MRVLSVNVGLPKEVPWRGQTVRTAIWKLPVEGRCRVRRDVPATRSCRMGVCHTCECGLVDGEVAYEPQPLTPPAEGDALTCCSRPRGDVALEL